MLEGAVDVRLATEAELEAVTALLVAQLRDHHVATPEAKLASAIEAVLRHPERGRILVAIERGRPAGCAPSSRRPSREPRRHPRRSRAAASAAPSATA